MRRDPCATFRLSDTEYHIQPPCRASFHDQDGPSQGSILRPSPKHIARPTISTAPRGIHAARVDHPGTRGGECTLARHGRTWAQTDPSRTPKAPTDHGNAIALAIRLECFRHIEARFLAGCFLRTGRRALSPEARRPAQSTHSSRPRLRGIKPRRASEDPHPSSRSPLLSLHHHPASIPLHRPRARVGSKACARRPARRAASLGDAGVHRPHEVFGIAACRAGKYGLRGGAASSTKFSVLGRTLRLVDIKRTKMNVRA
ncbi:hypothetical protein BC628DRAFT_66577 [Trametes gibbosa]|nr:hypothetical protein BC628DRAFT_66577 [Trametes gibbosa]